MLDEFKEIAGKFLAMIVFSAVLAVCLAINAAVVLAVITVWHWAFY